MAKSATTGFFWRKNTRGLEHPAPLKFIIANSATVKVGDSIVLNDAGFARRAAAGEPILGVAIGIVDKDGINLFGGRATGLTGATPTPDDQIAVSSTNQSDATRNIKVEVVIDPPGTDLWYNDADGDLAQTNVGQFFDSNAAGNQITQSTASDSNGQWQLLEIDPDGDGDASKGLFRIAESQLGGGLDSATDKIPA